MLFWILVAILTAAVAAALLFPLLRAVASVDVPQSHDVEVYRDQLDELTRDARQGLIGGVEADFAKAEVARRLLAAQSAVEASNGTTMTRRSNRLAQAAIIGFLPVASLCLYLTTGRPGIPDAPLAARLQNPGDDLNILVARVERQLALKPDDGAGWDLLAPIYYRTGRTEDAAAAFRKAIDSLGPTPERLAGYAESLMALSNGVVTQEAEAALRRLVALKPDDPRASFYLALAAEQAGNRPEALSGFRRIAGLSPSDAPWLPLVRQHIAGLERGAEPKPATAPGNPTADDIAEAQAMSAGDRQQMIADMIGSLEAKLKDDPNNFEGWMRLVRSHAVMGDKNKAAAALKQALTAFPPQGEEGRQLLALGAELGLPTEGESQ